MSDTQTTTERPVTALVEELKAGMSAEALKSHPQTKIHAALLWLEDQVLKLKAEVSAPPKPVLTPLGTQVQAAPTPPAAPEPPAPEQPNSQAPTE